MALFESPESVSDSFAGVLRVRCRESHNKIAQIFEGRETTYAQLDQRANQVAQGLIAAGCKPGARVGFMGKNSDSYFELSYGALKARTALVGVNWRLAAPEAAYVIKDCKAEILFVGKEFVPLVAQIAAECPGLKTIIAMDGGHDSWPAYEAWRDRHTPEDPMLKHDPDDDIIQLYTSGTTGYPKGVPLTNRNYLAALRQTALMGVWNEEGLANLVCMPVYHIAGINVGMIGFYFGSVNVVLRDVDPAEIVRLIEKHKIATAFMVPAVILFILMIPGVEKADFSSLRTVAYGASPIAEQTLLDARKLMKCDFVQVYGLTETTGTGTHLRPEDHDPARELLRSCGRPNEGMEIAILDEDGKRMPTGEVGEISMRSPSVMKGYWNLPDASGEAIDKDGWFRTGDAGFFNDEGFLFIHDRVKDMIVSGGENVYPAEVENALMAHEAVADAAAIGVPDQKWGEAVKGVVVLKPEAKASAEEIIAFVKTQIAGYKTPKSIDFAEALPRNPSGKILRRELRVPYWKGQTRQVS